MPWPSFAKALGLSEPGVVRGGFDRLFENLGFSIGTSAPQTSIVFTIAIIALAAKLSKSDGVSSPLESRAFFAIYKVPASELGNVRHVYEMAAQDARGFEYYADQVARLLATVPDLKVDVLAALFHIAAADGILHPGEEAFLKTVAGRFDLRPEQYAATRAQFIADASDPYVILGIDRRAGNDELKAHYRQLVKDTHPDTLAARGVPLEMTAHATRRIASITAAYRMITRDRDL